MSEKQPHETAGIYDAIELWKRFLRSAKRDKSKYADLLDARLVLSRGVNLSTLREGKTLSVAPFNTTAIMFWSPPLYKGVPMAETLGWELGCILWDAEAESMKLFATTKRGDIAMVPHTMTKKLEKGLSYWLQHAFAAVWARNPTSEWWGGEKKGSRGGTQHYYTKDPQKAPPAWAVHGTYRNSHTWKSMGLDPESTHSMDVRACLACYVDRGRGDIPSEKRERLERLKYTMWGAGELVDDQAGRLMAERGIKPKRPGEWIAVKLQRRSSHLRGHGKHVPLTRLSDA